MPKDIGVGVIGLGMGRNMLGINEDPRSRLQVRAWTARGVWAALDQGLFAISNFLVNVMLARTLPARCWAEA